VDEKLRQKLRNLYRVNRVLWIGIFAGIVTLLLIGYFLAKSGVVAPAETATGKDPLSNVFLIIAIILLYLVFHMKRTYLNPKKLIWRARKKKIDITNVDVSDFVAEFGTNADVLLKALMLLRRYYMVIWSLANVVALLGFIEFAVSGQLRVLGIYGVVSLYSMLVNYPSFGIIEQCHNVLQLEDLDPA